MADFIETMTTGVNAVLTLLGKVTTSMLGNELFTFGLSVLITVILISVVSSLVRRGRRG